MLKSLTGAVLFLALISAAMPAWAAPCKDAKTGKFFKCPDAPRKVVRCNDAKGRFAKCSRPGAKPI